MDRRQIRKIWLAWAEVPRVFYALATLPGGWLNLSAAQKGDRRPIVIIPGIGMTDRSTWMLRRYLTYLGYKVHPWGLGQNLGAKTIGLHNERLIALVQSVYDDEGQSLTLIGWSMGGIMARMVARRYPDQIREVITLGSPFGGDPFASSAWEVYERLSGHSLRHPVAQAMASSHGKRALSQTHRVRATSQSERPIAALVSGRQSYVPLPTGWPQRPPHQATTGAKNKQ